MNILLTGDDGYNSIGTRLAIHALREQHVLTIAGTKEQQSAVGGKMNVKHGGTWNVTSIEGVKALWVDGTPADAMECAHAYFDPFDLVISGVNLGENIGFGCIASGTVSAAQRAVSLSVAPRAIAISWTVPPEFYFKKHDEDESLEAYLDTPGRMVDAVLHQAIKQQLWGARMLNINLPNTHAVMVRFTRFTHDADDCYPPATISEDTQTYAYPFLQGPRQETDLSYDVAAISRGYISITPQTPDWTDLAVYEKVKEREIHL